MNDGAPEGNQLSGRDGAPAISVIVRSMDRPTLDAALDSIAAQDHPAIEVLVVDATGGTHAPVADCCGAVPLRLISTGRPLARAAAANAGLEVARGEWITWLDDDDLFLADHLSGLVTAHLAEPEAGVVHCHARAVFADGRRERFGQPHATLELFDRNYLHLSTAIVRRHVVADCRFDESLEVHEDWDFFIQLAQRTRFHFVPRETFVWHADAGTSGAGGGANQDDARFARFRERVYAKWTPERDALVDEVTHRLELAGAAARNQDYATAERHCRDALALSQNDPWALNMLAMIERSRGELVAARGYQELAVAVRPNDAGLMHNLALLHLAQGDRAAAMACTRRALALDAAFAPALRLRAELDAGPGTLH